VFAWEWRQYFEKQFDHSEQPITDLILFSDSKSVLQTLEAPHQFGTTETVTLTHAIHNMCISHNIQVILQLIPGHIGI
jgi:hypothetical protein